MRRDLKTLVKALQAFGVDARLEVVEASYVDYTKDLTLDPYLEDLLGDIEDGRKVPKRLVCTSPQHIRIYMGHIYLAFTLEGKYIGPKAPEDGGVLPGDLPDDPPSSGDKEGG